MSASNRSRHTLIAAALAAATTGVATTAVAQQRNSTAERPAERATAEEEGSGEQAERELAVPAPLYGLAGTGVEFRTEEESSDDD